MINRVQSVSNNNNYRQNFGELRIQSGECLELLANSMKMLHPAPVKPIKAGLDPINAFKEFMLQRGDIWNNWIHRGLYQSYQPVFARSMVVETDMFLKAQKVAEDTTRFSLAVKNGSGSTKEVHLATMSPNDEESIQLENVRQFLDNFTQAVNEAYEAEHAVN